MKLKIKKLKELSKNSIKFNYLLKFNTSSLILYFFKGNRV